jgi:heme exporter protein C
MRSLFWSLVQRDLRLAARRRVDLLLPLGFAVAAVSLFPLAVGPETALLRQIAAGVVWACALLSALMSVSALFASDAADGTLDQLLLAAPSPSVIAAARALGHWLLHGAPLVLLSPLLAAALGLQGVALAVLFAGLALGTVIFSLWGTVAAALTVGLRQAGLLVMLIVLPLAVPALVLGTGAVSAALGGLSPLPHLALLAAWMLVSAVVALPLAGAALRLGLDAGGDAPVRWTGLAAPPRFFAFTGRLLPALWALAAMLGAVGLVWGLGLAPTDAQQGEVYRIVYLHVPSAWVAMLLYLVMAFWATVGWVAQVRTAGVLARALAPTGAWAAAVCLVTGAIWGQPTWGTWWVWDARLTSMLILLLLYLGVIALTAAIDDVQRGDAAGALLAVVGVVNVPVIYFSVQWWSTLHQGATLPVGDSPRMAAAMLTPLIIMVLAYWAYAAAASLTRARALLMQREAGAAWLKAHLKERAA